MVDIEVSECYNKGDEASDNRIEPGCESDYCDTSSYKCKHLFSPFVLSLVIVSVVYYPKIVERLPPTIYAVVLMPSIT